MSSRFAHLDALRATAAALVCASHLRAFLLVDWSDVSGGGPALAGLYLVTGLGQQSVMIFFVLSGFFVGGSVAGAAGRGQFLLGDYALRRLVRLETVLVPALLMTWILDAGGMLVGGGAGYDGRYAHFIHSGPNLDSAINSSPSVFLGNLVFFMGILVPTFGSNGPLWSLAYEFWYYVIFPCLWITFQGRGPIRLCFLLIGVTIGLLLPLPILEGGVVWLLGFGTWVIWSRGYFLPWRSHPVWLVITIASFAMSLVASKLNVLPAPDLLVGVSTALLLTSLTAARVRNPSSTYARISAQLADGSYSLYLFHFPLLCFLFFGIGTPPRLQPSIGSLGIFLAIFVLTLGYCHIAWWCFERNTDAIRKQITAKSIPDLRRLIARISDSTRPRG